MIPSLIMREFIYSVASLSMGFLFYLMYLSCIHPITSRSIDTILVIITFHQHHCGDLWYQAAFG